MNRLSRLACVSFCLVSWLSGLSEAGEPAAKLHEENEQIKITQDAGKPLREGSLEAAGTIAALLEGLTHGPATRFESISIPATFKPWQGQELELAPDQHDGDSTRLRENMKHKGWECPTGYKAHHIVNKGDYIKNDVNYQALRDCLEQWGINIDAAGNGVCLPGDTKTAAKDEAASHLGREKALHGPDVTQYMLEQCQSALSRKNMQNKLDKWRRAMAKGDPVIE
jgi:A nuclease family of the HNH/ENDO VII superfamily with conserved AHH